MRHCELSKAARQSSKETSPGLLRRDAPRNDDGHHRIGQLGSRRIVEIVVDALHQQVELVGEEVVGARDGVVVDGDVPLGAQLVDQLLDRARSRPPRPPRPG